MDYETDKMLFRDATQSVYVNMTLKNHTKKSNHKFTLQLTEIFQCFPNILFYSFSMLLSFCFLFCFVCLFVVVFFLGGVQCDFQCHCFHSALSEELLVYMTRLCNNYF